MTPTNEDCTVEMLSCKVSFSYLKENIKRKKYCRWRKGLLWWHHSFLFLLLLSEKNGDKVIGKNKTRWYSIHSNKSNVVHNSYKRNYNSIFLSKTAGKSTPLGSLLLRNTKSIFPPTTPQPCHHNCCHCHHIDSLATILPPPPP